MRKFFVLFAAPLAMTACATASDISDRVLGTAELRMADGRVVGNATLIDNGTSLAIDIAVSGMPSGPKGFHLHTVGQCSPPDFQSAGGHLNPTNKKHGLSAPAGSHLGDLPNIQIEPMGMTRTRFALTGTAGELLPYVFDADGTAVMIHAKPDDNVTDPSGNSGDRIACGVVQPSE